MWVILDDGFLLLLLWLLAVLMVVGSTFVVGNGALLVIAKFAVLSL